MTQLKASYDAGLKEYENMKSSVYDYIQELYDTGVITQEQYDEMKETLNQQLETAQQEIQKLKAQLDEGQAEIDRNQAEISRGEAEIASGKQELEDGRAEIETAKAELKDAQKEIDKIEHPDIYVLGRDTNVGYVCFESDTSIVEGIALSLIHI